MLLPDLSKRIQLPEFETKAAELAFLHKVWAQFQKDAALSGTTLTKPESLTVEELVKHTCDFLTTLSSETLDALCYRIDVPEHQSLALGQAPDYWVHLSYLLLNRCAVKVMLRQSFSK